jgi:hypothetical protein
VAWSPKSLRNTQSIYQGKDIALDNHLCFAVTRARACAIANSNWRALESARVEINLLLYLKFIHLCLLFGFQFGHITNFIEFIYIHISRARKTRSKGLIEEPPRGLAALSFEKRSIVSTM